MNKDIIKSNLDRFDYFYIEKCEKLTVKLDYSLYMIVDFSDPNKIKIKDRLTSWNFLTGIFNMSINGAILYNFILIIIMLVLASLLYTRYDQIILLMILPIAILLNVFWILFYVIKADNFRRQIMYCTKK